MENKGKKSPMDPRLKNITKKDLDKPIYRIFSIKRLVEMFHDKELVMPKVNSWEDVYENFILKSNLSIEGDEITGLKEDSENYFGQCWGFIEDSDAMWRIYSPDKQNIRIKTTIMKLFNSVISLENCGVDQPEGFGIIVDTFAGKVIYKSKKALNTWIQEQKISNNNFMPNIIESLFIKRDAFKHESEIRIIYYADEEDSKLKSNVNIPLISFKINPFDLIDEIAFDPRVDDSYLNAYKSYLIKEFSFPEIKITKSKLYDFKPYDFTVK